MFTAKKICFSLCEVKRRRKKFASNNINNNTNMTQQTARDISTE